MTRSQLEHNLLENGDRHVNPDRWSDRKWQEFMWVVDGG
jgi:hypothetical protein